MLELMRPRSLPPRVWLAAAVTPLILAGCDRAPADPSTAALAFAQQITIPDAQGVLAAGTTRVKIYVIPGGLTAREVVIKEADELGKREQLESRVTSVAVSTTGPDTLVLELGSIRVQFDASTAFGEHEDEDEDTSPPTSQGEFVTRLQALLAAGRHPAVQVWREPPTSPQAPGDSTFTAEGLRLDESADRPSIEMNVTGANLLSNATPPPDAWLEVLARKIELRVSDGTTRIERQGPRTMGEIAVEGIVKSADSTANSATLSDGTILRIVAGTEIEPSSESESEEGHLVPAPDDSTLGSVAAVERAVAAGDTVIARGEGVLQTASPRTVDVIEVRFRIKEPAETEPIAMPGD
jgi:hypothetical protein